MRSGAWKQKVDSDDQRQVLLYEIYADQAACAAHLEPDQSKRFDRETRNWVLDKRVRQYRRLA